MADYPTPLVIPPLRAPHRQTFIILHGRGSEGEKFGPPLLDTPIQTLSPNSTSKVSSLAAIFPHARFVFPTAARRRATIYRRAYTHQWFDNWKLDPPATDREELQIPGLYETTHHIHKILRDEIAAVPGGAANVVLGGLSQGCAASLIAMLLWEGEKLAAGFGVCGWLPFAARLDDQILSKDDESGSLQDDGDSDPFERDNKECEDSHPSAQVASWLSEELEFTRTNPTPDGTKIVGMPIFFGHGVEDERVNVVLGRNAFSCLSKVGADACWHEYQGLGHWYAGNMLKDLVDFIQAKTNWSDEHIDDARQKVLKS